MAWLNYHHLLYFWQVAKEGSIARASAVLHLTPSTISLQVRQLEEQLGQQLFARVGKRLVLTESGQIAYRHAEMFKLDPAYYQKTPAAPPTAGATEPASAKRRRVIPIVAAESLEERLEQREIAAGNGNGDVA